MFPVENSLQVCDFLAESRSFMKLRTLKKRGGFFLAILFGACVWAGGQESGETIRLFDSGMNRAFVVAEDEYSLATASQRFKQVAVEVPRGDETARQRATALSAITGLNHRPVLYEEASVRTRWTRRIVTGRILVELAAEADALGIRRRFGLEYDGAVSYAPGQHLFAASMKQDAIAIATALNAEPGVISATPLLAKELQAKSIPNDPYFQHQWHLQNTGQEGGVEGIDVNITSVWDDYTGEGIYIAIVDDSLQQNHPDLEAHVDKSRGKDINDDDNDPSPGWPWDAHGTSVAGIAAGIGNNGLGIAGAAYDATMIGIRLISGPIDDADEAQAMIHANDVVHIKNNSWGPADEANVILGPSTLAANALRTSSQNGRNGRGTIFVFAAGNGGANGSNMNYNGYANSIYTIAVGAISDQGEQASYSTPGAGIVISAPSSSRDRQGTTTTDLIGSEGYNDDLFPDTFQDVNYTSEFGGTSSASPLVAGIIALMLEANPDLGWRDVQEILIRTGRMIDETDGDWVFNSAGFHFNHKLGAGMIDAAAAVAMAESWTNLPSSRSDSEFATANLPIPDNDFDGVEVEFNVDGANLRAEHVKLTVDIEHTYRGDLEITLVSPSGTESVLAERHGDPHEDYDNWTLMSVRHWGEDSQGVWTLRVADRAPGQTGVLRTARLEIIGTSAPETGSKVLIDGYAFSDSEQGNGNGQLDPGEIVAEYVTVKNFGNLSSAVTLELSSLTPGISVIEGVRTYPGLATGSSAINDEPFLFEIDPAFACGDPIVLQASLSGDGVDRQALVSHVLGRTSISTSTHEFTSSDTPASIPDDDEMTSELFVDLPEDLVIDDINVGVRIDHSWVGDLRLELEHPDGTRVVLASFKGDWGNAYGSGACGTGQLRYTVFDNDSSRRLQFAEAPFTGSFGPDGDLGLIEGRLARGLWKLHVLDNYEEDDGQLLCWNLQFSSGVLEYSCDASSGPPVAYGRSVFAPARGQAEIRLFAENPDGSPLTYAIVDQPAEGALSGFDKDAGTVIYSTTKVNAEDSFTFRVSDAEDVSETATIQVQITPDGDGNGLPDAWEVQNFGGIRRPNGQPEVDADLDGTNNLGEYHAGTLPRDASSRLEVSDVSYDGGRVRVELLTKNGSLYRLQRMDGLDGQWRNVGLLREGNGGVISLDDRVIEGAGMSVYRIVLVY